MSDTNDEDNGEGGLGSRDRLGRCKLGLLDGVGGLTLECDAEGVIVRGWGAWRPGNGALRYDDLRELFRPGAALTYQGPACSASNDAPRWDEVRLEVEITSVERCSDLPEGESRGPYNDSYSDSMVRLEIPGTDQRA